MKRLQLIISKKEIERRRKKIIDKMHHMGINALYLVSSANIAYVTNFFFIPTERPIASIIKEDGETIMFVPTLEVEHVEKYAYVDHIIHYKEFPDEKHPMEVLSEYLVNLGLENKTIGYDSDGYAHVFGYRGPKLSEVFKNAKYIYARDLIEDLRMIKSEEEIKLIEESAKWTTLAHRLLQEYTRPGLYEDYISAKASMKATLIMARSLKDIYRPTGWSTGAHAGFRGQIGEHSYFPHSLTIHAIIKRGDILVTGASALISGYSAELERTMIVGNPNEKQRKFFNLMLQAQQIALDNIKPDIRCADVDRAVRKFFKENGLWEYWRHHTGHGIGLEYHEAPFFDIGDYRVIKPGMVMTVEPGIYIKGLGGFRHSDTIVVREDGIEQITNYPKDLDSLIIRE